MGLPYVKGLDEETLRRILNNHMLQTSQDLENLLGFFYVFFQQQQFDKTHDESLTKTKPGRVVISSVDISFCLLLSVLFIKTLRNTLVTPKNKIEQQHKSHVVVYQLKRSTT